QYAPTRDGSPGRLLYVRSGALVAQAFDDRTLQLSGEPVQIAANIGIGPTPYAHFWVSNTNILAYSGNPAGLGGTPSWFDHSGRDLGPISSPAIEHASHPRI